MSRKQKIGLKGCLVIGGVIIAIGSIGPLLSASTTFPLAALLLIPCIIILIIVVSQN